MALTVFTPAPLPVNGYLWDTILRIDPTMAAAYDGKRPFFPMSDQAAGKAQWENKAYVVYDRMFSFNRSGSFYPIKNEQLMYSIKGTEVELFQWGSAVQMILDRQDDAGKDVNNWIRNNGGSAVYPIYFHSLRVHQTFRGLSGEAQNIRDESTRAKIVTDFIVSMEYHYTNSLEDYFA